MSWPDAVGVQVWLVPALQSQISTCVPLVWLTLGTSRQRLEATPRRGPGCPGGTGPPVAVTDRLSNWAVSPWLVPKPTCPTLHVASVTEPTAVPSIRAVIVAPEKDRASVCQRPVPSAAT